MRWTVVSKCFYKERMALRPATDESRDLGQGTYLSVYIDALIMCQALLIYELCMD